MVWHKRKGRWVGWVGASRCLGEALGSVHQLQSPGYSANHLLCPLLCEPSNSHTGAGPGASPRDRLPQPTCWPVPGTACQPQQTCWPVPEWPPQRPNLFTCRTAGHLLNNRILQVEVVEAVEAVEVVEAVELAMPLEAANPAEEVSTGLDALGRLGTWRRPCRPSDSAAPRSRTSKRDPRHFGPPSTTGTESWHGSPSPKCPPASR